MDADDERLTDWGASRRTYYGGDTADFEIGQKDEDAVEEEALARARSSARRWRRWTRTTSRWTVVMTMRWRRRVVICLRRSGGRAARAGRVDRKAIAERALEVLEAPVEGAEPSATILRLAGSSKRLVFMRRGLLRTVKGRGRRSTTTPDRAAFANRFTKFGGLGIIGGARDRHGEADTSTRSASRGGRFVRRFPGKTAEEAPEVRGEAALRVVARRARRPGRRPTAARGARAVVANKAGTAPHQQVPQPARQEEDQVRQGGGQTQGPGARDAQRGRGYGGEASGVRKGRRKSRRMPRVLAMPPVLVAAEVAAPGLRSAFTGAETFGRAQVRLGRALFNDSTRSSRL